MSYSREMHAVSLASQSGRMLNMTESKERQRSQYQLDEYQLRVEVLSAVSKPAMRGAVESQEQATC